MERSREPDAFTTLELEGWSRVIEDYQRHFGHLIQQAVEATLNAAGVKLADLRATIASGLSGDAAIDESRPGSHKPLM